MPRRYKIVCKNCGKEVISTGLNYCNVACKKEHTIKRHTRTCKICGKTFIGRQANKANRYCSRNCFYSDKTFLHNNMLSNQTLKAYQKEYGSWMKGKKNMGFGFKKGNISWNAGKHKTITFICLNCGKKITKQGYRDRKYCSHKCRAEHWRGKNSPSYKPESYIKKQCLFCGKEFITRPKYTNKGLGIFCSTKCASDYRTGDKNPSWKGGKSFEPYPPEFNSLLKRKIKERDNYICKLCGVPEAECLIPLNIHHINYNKGDCRFDNLISLCNTCHLKTNINREYWERYFLKNLQEV